MSKEIELSRRENGLTIRFLAQTLINDIVLPDQSGIKALLSRAKVTCKDGTEKRLPIHADRRFEYYFLFHMDDFGSGDKSEIDLLLRQGDTLFAVEVKAFTNPNDSNVKREIVRNFLTLERISNQSKFISPTSRIISILLYSTKEHLASNPSAHGFNYFNEEFLSRKGVHHKEMMTEWDCRSFKLKEFHDHSPEEWERRLRQVSSDLYFLTWDDVLATLETWKQDGRFSGVIQELRNKKDVFKGGTMLVKDCGLSMEGASLVL